MNHTHLRPWYYFHKFSELLDRRGFPDFIQLIREVRGLWSSPLLPIPFLQRVPYLEQLFASQYRSESLDNFNAYF
jgi:hypothetical protein